MPLYSVNATMSLAAWVYVDAPDAEAALEDARALSARDYEYDLSTAEVEFNVIPSVEEESP